MTETGIDVPFQPPSVDQLWKRLKDIHKRAGTPPYRKIEKETELPGSTVHGWFVHHTVPEWEKFRLLLKYYQEDENSWLELWQAAFSESRNRRGQSARRPSQDTSSIPSPGDEEPAAPVMNIPADAHPRDDESGSRSTPSSADAAALVTAHPALGEADPPSSSPSQADMHENSTPEYEVTGSAGPDSRRPGHSRGTRRKQPIILTAAAVTAVLILAAGYGMNVLRAQREPLPAGVAHASDQPTSAPQDCARFTVAARDLWLRDEHSEPEFELVHGQVVTVTERSNPNGLSYWKVTTEDGQQGWTDRKYLRPACK